MTFQLNYKLLYERLSNNDQSALEEIYKNKIQYQQDAVNFLQEYKSNHPMVMDDIYNLDYMMKIANAIYNSLDAMTIIEDGIYDQLMVIYKDLMPNYQVGGIPLNFEYTGNIIKEKEDLDGYYNPIQVVEGTEDWLFGDELLKIPPFDMSYYPQNVDRSHYEKNEKKNLLIPHNYPKLVGTLDKCKFTLISEAVEVGADKDPTIKIFERDFLGAHMQAGIINPNHIRLLIELKMDGMSVEADVTNEVLSARSRGDTNLDMADDLTTVLKGYKFPHCPELDSSFGMKFEAIITKDNLERLSVVRGRPYKNARNAIVGLMGSLDAAAFQDFITLVPLETSLDIDPISEVNFMNKYFTKNVYLPYAVIEGDYTTALFQVYKFVKEAEAMRPIANFLYDGVVVHYIDQDVRNRLGRINSVNQYSIAIKFNPMVKQTIFRGYTYSIGQNGVITPLAHYDPVEFLGTIHTKSSCHSYGRFKELALAPGDVIEVAYVNDVMPYVSRPYASYVGEFENEQPPIQFPMTCPCCGAIVTFSDDQTSAYCTNFYCPERSIARLANMMDKLSFKGFAESSIRKLQVNSFTELINISNENVIRLLGEGNGNNFIQARNQFLSTPIQDYRLIGSLGFTNTAAETWKKILSKIPIVDLIKAYQNRSLGIILKRVKGIGPITCKTIENEFMFYINDISTILSMRNIIYTYGMRQITVRWTGCRDSELESTLCAMGVDANSKLGVTKNTDILIVPYNGYASSKLSKIGPKTFVIPLDMFKKDYRLYLSKVK